MLDGIKIMLERMRTNPEEFQIPSLDNRRWWAWRDVISRYKDVINAEEMDLLNKKLREVNAKHFNKEILEVLMDDSPEQIKINYSKAQYEPFGQATVKAQGTPVKY
jgi:hypothetical protein